MRLRFSRKEDKFFALLRQSAANISAISAALVDLMEEYENVPDKVARIKDLEHVGDEIMHTIMALLHSTFVTPIDKEDISILASRMDDVVDAIDEAAHDMIEAQTGFPIVDHLLKCSRQARGGWAKCCHVVKSRRVDRSSRRPEGHSLRRVNGQS